MKLLTDAKEAIEVLLRTIRRPDEDTPLEKQDIYESCDKIIKAIKEVEK